MLWVGRGARSMAWLPMLVAIGILASGCTGPPDGESPTRQVGACPLDLNLTAGQVCLKHFAVPDFHAGESAMAGSPTDPARLAVTWQTGQPHARTTMIEARVTADGGKTWKETVVDR